jgi:hypothetical protein
MKSLGTVLPSVLLAALCASLASCANPPSGHAGPQAQGAPAVPNQETAYQGGDPQPALTIQSGEGEKLNLPWFVRDVQDWVNQRSVPADPARPPVDR